jgi:hypothetical protein
MVSSCLGGFAAQEVPAVVVLVEPVEQRLGGGEGVGVVANRGQAAQDYVEAGRLGGVVPAVVEVGFVDDARDRPQGGVGELVAAQDRFEAAVVAVVARSAPRRSNGVASAGTSSGSLTNTNSASGSMSRRISQAQAARSMCTPARVAHFMLCPR